MVNRGEYITMIYVKLVYAMSELCVGGKYNKIRIPMLAETSN